MKKLTVLALLIAALALPTFAQEATLATPVERPAEAKLTVEDYGVRRSCACGFVSVSVQDASGNEIRQTRYAFPDPTHTAATAAAWHTALATVRASETGTANRRMNFRILGFLVDQGYLTNVTLVP